MLVPFWRPKIGPKVNWITVEGVYVQSLISNTPYTVLKDFGVERPPQIGPKLIKNRFQNGTWGLYAKSDFENPLYSLKGFWGRGATPN